MISYALIFLEKYFRAYFFRKILYAAVSNWLM